MSLQVNECNGRVFVARSVYDNQWLRSDGAALDTLLAQHTLMWPNDAYPRFVLAVSPPLCAMGTPLGDGDQAVVHYASKQALLTWRGLYIPLYWLWLQRARVVCELRYRNNDRLARAFFADIDQWMRRSLQVWGECAAHLRSEFSAKPPRTTAAATAAAPAARSGLRASSSSSSTSAAAASAAATATSNMPFRVRFSDGSEWGYGHMVQNLARKHSLSPLIVQTIIVLSNIDPAVAKSYDPWLHLGMQLFNVCQDPSMERVWQWWSYTQNADNYKAGDWRVLPDQPELGGTKWRSFRVWRDKSARQVLANIASAAKRHSANVDMATRVALGTSAVEAYARWTPPSASHLAPNQLQ
jgi:hypothetical protein